MVSVLCTLAAGMSASVALEVYSTSTQSKSSPNIVRYNDLIRLSPSIDKPYPVTGGIFREEAIMLLRKFYVQENDKAPEPKQKKTRELKTEILPMDIHAPKSMPSPALPIPNLPNSVALTPALS
jgi:hypothetical protein